MYSDQIVHYYETCEEDYRLFWDLAHSHAMHAGYWDETTKTLREALQRENEILAERAQIKSSDHVLDAGCGIGGSSLYLAQNYHCQVTGITLSQKQVETAQKLAQQKGLENQVHFEVMDYTHTTFPDHSFDVVWGVESICHTLNKRLFIKEAFRLLKPKGRLIVADGFAKQAVYSAKDQVKMDAWLQGWGVSTLAQASYFERDLQEEGFTPIHFEDITTHVIPSSRRLYWISWPAWPLSKIGEWLNWRQPSQTANIYGARCQYLTLKKGLWQYGIFYAEKS